MAAKPRLTVILAADVVGYTAMMNADHEAALAALRSARDTVIEPAIARHRGQVAKRLGDGWLAAFESADDAVACAIVLHDGLEARAGVRLRVGIHRGDATFIDDDVFGAGVNGAARLEGLAAPGGTAVSEGAFARLEDGLKRGFENAGPRSLKGFSEPVAVWTRGGLPPAATEADDDATILVRGFDVRGDAALADFAVDLSDELTAELARYRWLGVVAPDDVAHGVLSPRYTVGGTLRRSGERVRVTADLTAQADGRRLWSDRFERDGDDPFALQDAFAALLAPAIAAEIDAHEKLLARMRPVELLNATELSLRTNEVLSAGRIDGLDEAAALAERAVALEPLNAKAHVQRALVGYRKALSGAWPAASTLAAALDLSAEAIRLDPRLSGGHVVRASILGMLGETDRALATADEGERLNPNAWGASHARSIAYAFASPARATEIDPQAAELIAHSEQTLDIATASSFRSGHLFYLGLGYLMRDAERDLGPAIAMLARSGATDGATWWPGVFIALGETRRGDAAAAVGGIEAARNLFPALSLMAIRGIFGQSRIWQTWAAEFANLPELGLPET